jgi:hypothetical protein
MTPDFEQLAERGAHFYAEDPVFTEDAWKSNFNLAMDAQPALTTLPNSGIPAWLTTFIDPTIISVLFSPLKAAKIFGEVKKGDWLMQTALFPIVEYTGEVSSYGDFNNNGRTGLNTDFPNRQSYLYQIIKEYGELEMERAGLARIAWAAELDKAAINILNRFQNNTYFFGVQGLQNYGGLNDPNLTASLTPAAKAAGGTTWFVNGNPNATANEVYNDILSIYEQLVIQAGGVVELDMEQTMVLAMSPAVQVALDFTNTFGITTRDMLRKSFPNMRMETAVQYGVQTASNVPGIVAGNYVQLIAENAGGQDTAFCAFNEKLRTHKIVIDLSSYKQKATQGTWGTVIRQPYAIASMLGV